MVIHTMRGSKGATLITPLLPRLHDFNLLVNLMVEQPPDPVV